ASVVRCEGWAGCAGGRNGGEWARSRPETGPGTGGYCFNRFRSIFRKKTSAPSDWKRILPFVWLACVATLTTVPFRVLVILSPSQTHSRVFHSPTGFSTSWAPRKPLTSFHSGSRPYQLMRPRLVSVTGGAPGL